MLWKWFISLFIYPIRWFWEKYTECKETNNLKRMILLFAVSLTGIAAFAFVLLFMVAYMLNNHLNIIIVLSLILWLYAYVRDKYLKKAEPESVPIDYNLQYAQAQAQEQAEIAYPIMRNIVFQTAKAIATDIGGKIPRLLREIEMPEGHYIFSNNICFYQFRLIKEDMQRIYSSDDLRQFKEQFQFELSRKIQAGEFPAVQLEKYRDQYGNWYESIILDSIEDIGNSFILQTVFCTPEYAVYSHQVQMNQDALDNVPDSLEEQWSDKK